MLINLEKLYALVDNEIEADNLDSTVNHEIMLFGQLYSNLIVEKLKEALRVVRAKLLKEASKQTGRDINYIKKLFTQQIPIGHKMEYFLATENLISNSNLDMQQITGFTIVAETLNFLRYLFHYRSIHIGHYFSEMKTTSVRKLLPEFLCPVHTPDGAPCGLLNHLSHTCDPCTRNQDISTKLIKICFAEGMNSPYIIYPNKFVHILLDGVIIGYIAFADAESF